MVQEKERVAIVTGGARGIGLGISHALADAGKRIAIVYHKNKKSAEAAQSELSPKTEVMLIQADVSNILECPKVVAQVEDAWGRVDVLVNNAGVFDYKQLEDMDLDFLNTLIKRTSTAPCSCRRQSSPR
jgi:Dehydrogenases with different specificities (related to short-chain alcohol dehydrogenases)